MRRVKLLNALELALTLLKSENSPEGGFPAGSARGSTGNLAVGMHRVSPGFASTGSTLGFGFSEENGRVFRGNPASLGG